MERPRRSLGFEADQTQRIDEMREDIASEFDEKRLSFPAGEWMEADQFGWTDDAGEHSWNSFKDEPGLRAGAVGVVIEDGVSQTVGFVNRDGSLNIAPLTEERIEDLNKAGFLAVDEGELDESKPSTALPSLPKMNVDGTMISDDGKIVQLSAGVGDRWKKMKDGD